jgi:hydroxymethylpyrimidine/phosphomethylpyrimidine kinase
MVATTGAKLLPQTAVRNIIEKLLPLTTILTPNIPEADTLYAALVPGPTPTIENELDFQRYVEALYKLLPCPWLLVKGGHCPFTRDGKRAETEDEKEMVVDILFGPGRAIRINSPYQRSRHTHGTGCSLACKLHDACSS